MKYFHVHIHKAGTCLNYLFAGTEERCLEAARLLWPDIAADNDALFIARETMPAAVAKNASKFIRHLTAHGRFGIGVAWELCAGSAKAKADINRLSESNRQRLESKSDLPCRWCDKLREEVFDEAMQAARRSEIAAEAGLETALAFRGRGYAPVVAKARAKDLRDRLEHQWVNDLR